MAKYSYEFKKKVVEAYLQGEGGYEYLCKIYGIKSHSNLEKWVASYKEYGDEGLMRSRRNNSYTFQFKLFLVESYLSSELSYQELALKNKINNSALIAKWVNDFRIAGPDALRPKKKGRKKTLNKSTEKDKETKTNTSLEKIDTSVQHIKELEDELLKLRIENAYLKELRRLRLEEEALLKNSENYPQPPRRIQIKGYSRNC